MKAKLILTGLFASTLLIKAQTSNTPWPSSGNVGIGTLSPAEPLHIWNNNSTGSGMKITQPGIGAAWISLENTNTGGKNFLIHSSGLNNGEGAGCLVFRDASAQVDRIVVNPSGYVGIGTMAPANGQLEIVTDVSGNGNKTGGYFTSNANASSDYYGVWGRALSTNGQGYWQVGVQGEALTTGSNCGTQNMGFWGTGEGAYANFGGLFIGGGAPYPGTCCGTNVGVWGTTGGYCSNNSWAGFFDGDVGYTGSLIHVSDKKLKKDIKPMGNMMEKIMLLKPSTFTFKEDAEYKDMNLPKGNQFGLIAQELEEVFPDLIHEVAELSAKGKTKEIHSSAFKGVQYLPFISILIAGMQEQQRTILSQQAQLDEHKQTIASLNDKLSGATGINTLNSIESGFQMAQNEPNPFTHETVVKYTLSKNVGNAFMAVYDLTGKQITTFSIAERGSAALTITSEKLAAGIYIYSIVADGKIMDSKRMIVSEK